MEQYWIVEHVDENLPEQPKYRNMCFCNARGREKAKQRAQPFLGGNPDEYVVTPLTNPGEIVKLKIVIDPSEPSQEKPSL